MPYLSHLRWLVPAIIIVTVLYLTLGSTSPLVVASNFSDRRALVDVLLPASRVERVGDNLTLVREPVYVDVTLPLRSSAVTLELEVSLSSVPLKLGVQQGAGWDIVFPETAVVERGRSRFYTLRVSEFKYLEPGYRLRFVVSAPGLSPGSIVVHRGRVTIERHPFSWGWLGALLGRFPKNIL